MKAVIMAGGEGTRLRPLTCGKPKPMVPVANKPVMEYIVELLKKYGFQDVAVTLQYMPQLIKEYFGDGSEYGLRIKYYVEERPLGTAGSVKNAEKFLDDTFIVISGDALTDINLKKAVEFHEKRESMVTLVLKRVDVPLEYGVVVTDEDGRIIRFLEKPGWGEVFSDTVNTGIYILSPYIFNYIKNNQVFDFSKDLFPVLLKEKKPMYGFISDDYWCDIGDLGAYIKASSDILAGKVEVNIPGSALSSGIWIGSGSIIDDGARMTAPCIIGSDSHIRAGAEIGSFSVIGDNNIIYENCGIKRSVLWKNCTINKNVQLRGSVICEHVQLREGVTAFEQSVVGDYSVVGEQALIRPSVKIWPDKYIEQGAELDGNLVWGSKAGRQIFGNRGVSGEINTDITPEFAAKLGAAYGAVFAKKGGVGVCCDDSPAASMIKSAFVSGLASAGIRVNDFGRLLIPAMRYAIRFFKLNGGICINSSNSSNSRIMIDFFDKKGSNIDRNTERKIENAFIREDFNRCEGDCLKPLKRVQDFQEFYSKNILNEIKSDKLNYKIALRTCSEFSAATVYDLLHEAGCEIKTWVGAGINGFSSEVKKGGYDLGVSIEESCEKMLLVDSRGRLVTEDMFIALISLVLFKTIKGGTVMVPVSASRAVDILADEYQGRIIRTKTAARDIMGRLLGKEVKEELLEQFTMHFDAIAGLVKLLDFMTVNNLSLTGLIDILPEIHMHRREVECKWNTKGRVIRKLIQENSRGKIETTEGVKIYNDNGWVLVLPDADRPVVNIIGEGDSVEFAEELTNIYARKVREISRSL